MPEEKKWEDVSFIALPSEKTAEINYWEAGKLKQERVEFERLNLENTRILPSALLLFRGLRTTCTLDERGVLTCKVEVPI
jgi:hypothetical protein